MVDTEILIGQTIVSFITLLVSLYMGFKIFRKDPTFLLNKLFSMGIILIGFASFFIAFSNIPVLLNNEASSPDLIKISYTLAPISLSIFLLSSIYLRYGQDILYSKSLLIFFSVFLTIGIVILWLTPDAVVPGEPGDITTSILFKIFILGYLIICYLVALYFFIQIYRLAVPETKTRMRYLLLGWLSGGLTLLSIGIGDYIRIFDLIGPIFLSIASILINFSFTRK